LLGKLRKKEEMSRQFRTVILITFTCLAKGEDRDEVVPASGLIGGTVRLPCDTTPPTHHNPLLLTVWFKDRLQDPIYSYDVREDIQAFGKHWYDDLNLGGRAFFGGENKTSFLSIENLKDSDRGAYRCRVDFKQAPSRIYKLSLEVVVLPSKVVIVTKNGNSLEDERYNEGSDLKLMCSVTGGRPTPKIIWITNGTEVHSTKLVWNKDRSLSSVLDFGPVSRPHHGGKFICSVSNTNLSTPTTASAELTLKLLPLLVSIDNPRDPLTANKSTSLSCTSYGSNPPALLSWWFDGFRIQDHDTEVSLLHNMNSTNSIMKFTPNIEDTGKFLKCRAENLEMPASQIEDSWNLDVNYIPSVELTLGPTLDADKIKEGDDVYFECNIDAKPVIYKTSWWFNGEELKQNVRDGIIMGNQSLVLQTLKRDNTGTYSCQATNTVGRGRSRPRQLDIKYKPICSLDQKKIYGVARGEVVSINCSVSANPGKDLVFRWTFNNTSELANIQDNRFSQNGTMSRLIYSPYHELDYGTILCWATNKLGEQEEPCTFHIIPAGPPEPPLNCFINISKEHNLDTYCDPGFDGGLPQEFSMTVFSTKNNKMISIRTSPLSFFSVEGLQQNKTTIFRVHLYSFNSKGKSEVIILPDITLDGEVSELNGPIIRAAQEGNSDNAVKSSNAIAELQDFDIIHEQDSPLVSILCGVVSAIVVVFIVIAITMRIRCGRQVVETTWRKECSSESSFEISHNSPDMLVKNIAAPTYDFQFQSLFLASKPAHLSSTFYQSATLPKKIHSTSHYSMDSLLTLHGLPPPPAAPVEMLPSPELHTLLPPPVGFYTLPRLRRSVSGATLTPTSSSMRKGRVDGRSVSFLQDSQHSQSVSSIEHLRRSSSHVESIV